MKQILATGFLFLLLLNMLGQSVAVWFIEEMHNNPTSEQLGDELVEIKIPLSIPYGSSWQNDDPSGLIRYGDKFYNIVEQRYENDSLYTLMQANLSAREQFFALADQIQQEFGHDQNHEGNPFERSAKLFSTAIKHYMTSDRQVTFFLWEVMGKNPISPAYQALFSSYEPSPVSPPPDFV
ncbi:MAG: hypothetical protein KKG00_15270 [Bacteroidetes bacterium]|nr:hypothetical protein [Bacteroidota bacterium]